MKKLLIPLLAISLTGAALAHAHMKSVTVLPGTPRQVRVTFTEAVNPTVSTIQIYSGTTRVDTGVKSTTGDTVVLGLKPDVKPGAYQVKWNVMAADDGHVTHGATPFTVDK